MLTFVAPEAIAQGARLRRVHNRNSGLVLNELLPYGSDLRDGGLVMDEEFRRERAALIRDLAEGVGP